MKDVFEKMQAGNKDANLIVDKEGLTQQSDPKELEKIVGSDAQFNEIMIDLYQDMKIRNGLNPIDNQKKSKSLRGIMTPISLDENKSLLRKCGFYCNDIIFKWYNFAGFIAIK